MLISIHPRLAAALNREPGKFISGGSQRSLFNPPRLLDEPNLIPKLRGENAPERPFSGPCFLASSVPAWMLPIVLSLLDVYPCSIFSPAGFTARLLPDFHCLLLVSIGCSFALAAFHCLFLSPISIACFYYLLYITYCSIPPITPFPSPPAWFPSAPAFPKLAAPERAFPERVFPSAGFSIAFVFQLRNEATVVCWRRFAPFVVVLFRSLFLICALPYQRFNRTSKIFVPAWLIQVSLIAGTNLTEKEWEGVWGGERGIYREIDKERGGGNK